MKLSPIYFSSFMFILVSLMPISYVFSFNFTLNMREGESSNTVKELQIVLNSNSSTQIADNGPGSPGLETNYFGVLTKNAVIRFQQLYKDEILFPAGLKTPTGFVGPLTRLKLNSISSLKSKNSTVVTLPKDVSLPKLQAEELSTQNFSNFSSFFFSGKPKILGLSQYEAERGQSVKVYGQGFAGEGNKIHFGHSGVSTSANSQSGFELIFTVPDSIALDKYYLWVENVNGSSFEEDSEEFFTVSSQAHGIPVITSITPSKAHVSSVSSLKIVISGSNFSKVGNIVYSSIGTIKNLSSSDGSTIEFLLSDFERIHEVTDMKKFISKGTIPIPMIVKTDYGFSGEEIYLVIEF